MGRTVGISGPGLDSRVPVDVVLRDGSTVSVRPVQPGDIGALESFLGGLSPESRRLRFFTAGADLSGAARWAARAEDRHGLGLVATTGEPWRIVGHAGYERIDAERAEIAFEVADALRGRGLATILMAHLAQAAGEAGIATFVADVLPENRRMLDVFRESGFPATLRAGDEGLVVEFPTALTREALERYEERERTAAAAAVAHFLRPASVAVVGASRRPGTVGSQVLANLLRSGFEGPVYPVNPRARTVQSLPAHGSVADLPEAVELAVVAVPAEAAAEVARECALKGVRALLVLSAGFAEAGPAGARRQEELVAVCRAAGMRLIGPNCLGVAGAEPPIDVTFVPHRPPPGRVALLSQSGGVGLALIEQAAALRVGLSSFVSVGNRPDISPNDVLEYWLDDDSTDVVLLYLESVGDPRNFARIARGLARTKRLAAVRAGRSGAGARAAASHTGAAVASSDVGVEELFRQAGIVHAESLGELFDVGALLASQPLPAGRRVGIVTNAGGPAVLCADACHGAGLEVPVLSPRLGAELAAALPAHAATGNPVDMLAAAGPAEFGAALTALMRSGEVDAVVALFTPALAATAAEVVDAIDAAGEGAAKAVAAVDAAAREAASPRGPRPGGTRPAGSPAVPVVAVVFGETPPERGEGAVPLFAYPENAARALARAAELAEWRRTPAGELPALDDVRPGAAASMLAAAVADGGRWLTDGEVATLLGSWGLPLVDQRRARGPAAAGRAAAELGGPVVLKAAADGLVHKTEAGAVELGLEGDAAVRRAAERMSRRLRRAGLRPREYLVQRQAEPGVEMLAGITSDPQLGPLVACGAGGTAVELIGDVAVRLAPLTDLEASRMVRSLTTFPLLDGYRGGPKADVPAFEELLLRLGALADAHPEVIELDLNPVIVGERGAVAVDARVRVEPPRRQLPWPAVGAAPPVRNSPQPKRGQEPMSADGPRPRVGP
jgi:acyl-CoA synthetase (NDP forming)